jgi:hypothetical protein
MKTTIKKGLVTLGIVLGLAITVNAQSKTERPAFLLSAGPEAGLPVGNWNNNYNWSLGGSVQADLAIVKKTLYVNLNAGFTNVFADNGLASNKDLQLIPVKAGLRYYPVNNLNLYVQGQAGVTFLTNTPATFDGKTADYKSAVFVYSPQIGYLIDLGKGSYLDAAVKFEGNSAFVDGGDPANLLGVRVAYGIRL